MKRIHIKLFSLPKQRISQAEYAYLELHDNRFRYHCSFFAAEPKEGTAEEDAAFIQWNEDLYRHSDFNVPRAHFASINLIHNALTENWHIELEFLGVADTLTLFFDTFNSAEPVLEELNNYFFRSVPAIA